MVKRYLVFLFVVGLVTGCSQPEAKADVSNSSNSGEAQQAALEEVEDKADTAAAKLASLQISSEELETRLELPDVIERVMPSVVGITTERTIRQRSSGGFGSPFGDHPFFRDFGPFGPQQQPQPQNRTQQNVGSGVIVDAAGIVITNNHVIERADSILVNMSDGRELEAEVEGTDPESDIAVLRIVDAPDDLEALDFGDSDILRLGESVIAIGNPFGLSGTVTMGIISAKGRAGVGILDYENFIQTDAAINPGNSGGALINLDGELIGINTAIMTRSGGYQGVGFAIPSNMAEMVMTGLLEDGRVARGWLGVVIQQLTPELAQGLELDDGLEGVVVSDVQPGSPAEDIGLSRGDVITHVDGRPVRSPQELRNTVGLRSPNTDIDLKYVRNGTSTEQTITLGSLEEGRAHMEGRPAPGIPEVATGIEGLQLQPLDQELRRELDIPRNLPDGVVVTGVDPRSEAAQLDLRPGDVILEVNRQSVSGVDEFNAAYDGERPRNLFLLYRDGSTIFMTR